jgi:hypothetical protein
VKSALGKYWLQEKKLKNPMMNPAILVPAQRVVLKTKKKS